MKKRFFIASFGRDSVSLLDNYSDKNTLTIDTSNEGCTLVNRKEYDTGLPEQIVWEGDLGVYMHGIAFPKGYSLDSFAQNAPSILKELLRNHNEAPEKFPYSFDHGSFVGFILNKKTREVWAFTSFLNSFPLYWHLSEGQLIISDNLNEVAKVGKLNIKSVHSGLLEYYTFGTNLSEASVVENVNAVHKGGYIHFKNGTVRSDFYYVLPDESPRKATFDETLELFAELWPRTLKSLDSAMFGFGLGFTGGIDSRLILAAWPEKENLTTFTGGSKFHSDYLLGRHIVEKTGLQEKHHLEDYTHSEKLKGYAEMLMMADNPSVVNAVYFMDQFRFRETQGFQYELMGLTEYLGGVYHYESRASVKSTIKMSLPVKTTPFDTSDTQNLELLLKRGLRDDIYTDLQNLLPQTTIRTFEGVKKETIGQLNRQINATETVEAWLERFRHIHKMANLLTWSRVPGRNFNERLSPSMNIEMTDFTAKTPLEFRDSRRLLLAYLKRYHPKFASFVLSGSVFSPNTPWVFHKFFNPYIKVINATGLKVPGFQWYIQKGKKGKSLQETQEFSDFQKTVCHNSAFINDTELSQVFNKNENHAEKRWRLFNIALTEKRINTSNEGYQQFINECLEKSTKR